MVISSLPLQACQRAWFVREDIANLEVGNWERHHNPDCRDDLKASVTPHNIKPITQTHSDRI